MGIINTMSNSYAKPLNFSQQELPEFIKKNGLLLHIGFISQKDIRKFLKDLTYRQINHWSNKGLVVATRNNVKSGWRKFSLLDVIKLQIISDLRKFGCSLKIIKIILNNLEKHYFAPLKDKKQSINKSLEFFLFSSMLGEKNFLMIENDGNISFLNHQEFKNNLLNDKMPFSYVILPFYLYTVNIANTAGFKVKNDVATTFKN